ncbi:MAG: hypothetical protein ACYTDW_09125 [Planctomycetota bacterium]|jgi:hypothetical protein
MYHADVIADRVQNLEKAFEVDLVEHPVDLIREFRGRLQHAVDAKSNLVRDLSSEELTFIHNERLMSKASFEYWAERYAFINKQGAEVGPMYPLWESQRLILSRIADLEKRSYFDDHPDGVLANILKARQLGASTISECMGAHRATTQMNIFGLVAADVPEQSGFTFDMLERVVEHLPWYMKPKVTDHVKNTEIAFDTGSHVWVGSGKSTRGTVGKRGQLGRGKTLSYVHLTELSTWEDTDQIDEALLPTVHIHPRNLVLFESTAKGRHNWWHGHWNQSKLDIGRFTPIFIPWYAEKSRYWLPAPIDWYPKAETIAHAKRCEETGPRWMGRSVRLTRNQLFWYETTREALEEKGRLYAFLEEYCADDEEAFQYAGYGVFDVASIERVRSMARPLAGVVEVSRPFGTI